MLNGREDGGGGGLFLCAHGIQFRFTAVCLFWEDAGGLTRQRAFIIGAHSSRGVLS